MNYTDKFAERREIKRKALMSNLNTRIEKARYECYKEIQAQGGLYENLGDKQERELMDFINQLACLSISYDFIKELKNRAKAFIAQLKRLDDGDLQEINRFIANYERKTQKVA